MHEVTVTARVNGSEVGKEKYTSAGRRNPHYPVPAALLKASPVNIEFGLVGLSLKHPDTTVLEHDDATELAQRVAGAVITFVHTEVPSELEGRGVGGELVRSGLEYARSNALRVVPQCSFVASYLKRHPEYTDLVTAK